MTDREFSIGDRRYQLNKIDVFMAIKILRRLLPLIGDLLPAVQKVSAGLNKSDLSEDDKLSQMAAVAQPLMTGLSKLSDADSDFVLMNLWQAVEMYQADHNSWARVARADAGLMFQNLELPTLLQLAGRAFLYNLGSFFELAPKMTHGGA